MRSSRLPNRDNRQHLSSIPERRRDESSGYDSEEDAIEEEDAFEEEDAPEEEAAATQDDGQGDEEDESGHYDESSDHYTESSDGEDHESEEDDDGFEDVDTSEDQVSDSDEGDIDDDEAVTQEAPEELGDVADALASITPGIASLMYIRSNAIPFPTFFHLTPRHRFDNLRQALQDWSASVRLTRMPRLPVEALISLCFNDYSATRNQRGRIRHPWGQVGFLDVDAQRTMYYASRAWSEVEGRTWEQWSPSQRLVASSVNNPFHWSSGKTGVVPIRILRSNDPATEGDDDSIQQFNFSLPGRDFYEVLANPGPSLFLVIFRKQLYAVSWSELCQLPQGATISSRQLPADGQIQQDIGPFVAPRTLNRRRQSKKGLAWLSLLIPPSTAASKSWLQNHLLEGECLEAALLTRCERELFDCGPAATVWSEEFDRAMLFDDRTKDDVSRDSNTPLESGDALALKPSKSGVRSSKLWLARHQRKLEGKGRWSQKRLIACKDLLFAATIAGLDDEAAIKEASQQLSQRQLETSPLAIKRRFYKTENKWKQRVNLVKSVKRRGWLIDEDEALLLTMAKMDTSICIADRISWAAEDLAKVYGFERTHLQVLVRWCELRMTSDPARGLPLTSTTEHEKLCYATVHHTDLAEALARGMSVEIVPPTNIAPGSVQAIWDIAKEAACLRLLKEVSNMPRGAAFKEVQRRLRVEHEIETSILSIEYHWYKDIRLSATRDEVLGGPARYEAENKHSMPPKTALIGQRVMSNEPPALSIDEQVVVLEKRVEAAKRGLVRAQRNLAEATDVQRRTRAAKGQQRDDTQDKSPGDKAALDGIGEISVPLTKPGSRWPVELDTLCRGLIKEVREDPAFASKSKIAIYRHVSTLLKTRGIDQSSDSIRMHFAQTKALEPAQGPAQEPAQESAQEAAPEENPWTAAEDILCRQQKEEISRDPAFSKKSDRAVCEEISRRMKAHNFERSASAIDQRLDEMRRSAPAKNPPWSLAEDALCRKLLQEIPQEPAFAGKSKPAVYDEISRRLKAHNFKRTAGAVKAYLANVHEEHDAEDDAERTRRSIQSWSEAEINLCKTLKAEISKEPAFAQKARNNMPILSEVSKRLLGHGYKRSASAIDRKLNSADRNEDKIRSSGKPWSDAEITFCNNLKDELCESPEFDSKRSMAIAEEISSRLKTAMKIYRTPRQISKRIFAADTSTCHIWSQPQLNRCFDLVEEFSNLPVGQRFAHVANRLKTEYGMNVTDRAVGFQYRQMKNDRSK